MQNLKRGSLFKNCFLSFKFALGVGAIFVAISHGIATPPYEPYSAQPPKKITLEGGKTVVIRAIRVSTDLTTQERGLYIDYSPSSSSTNMWKQVTEMQNVAQHFCALAPTERAGKIWVRPMLQSNKISSSENVAYPYSISNGVIVPAWQVEAQPWFNSDKNKD